MSSLSLSVMWMRVRLMSWNDSLVHDEPSEIYFFMSINSNIPSIQKKIYCPYAFWVLCKASSGRRRPRRPRPRTFRKFPKIDVLGRPLRNGQSEFLKNRQRQLIENENWKKRLV